MQFHQTSSASYDFRKDFDGIARPGLHRFLDISADLLGNEFDAERRAGYAKSYVRDLRRTLKSEQQEAELREGIDPSPPMGSPPGTPAYIPPPWDAERAALLAAEFEADVIHGEKRGAAETKPVDINRAVRLGTEMARKQGLETGPEAVAYATERLKSKIERGAVYNPIEEMYSGFLSYRFLKEMRGGGKVVYIDHYKRRQLEPKPPAPADDWLVRYVRNHGPLSIHRWGALFPRRSLRYALYRFERLYRAGRLTRAWMPHISGVISEPLCYAPKPPKSRKSAMTTATAIHAITVPQAFGVVRKVAPEIFASFKATLAKLGPYTRDKECEAAIRYAADVVADADVSESSHAEVAKRALTECLRRSLRYVAPENVVQFPSGEPEAAQRENGRCSTALPIITALELRTKDVGKPEFIVEGWIQNRRVGLVLGEDGAGKSFLLLLLAIATATGGNWLGIPVEQGRLYFSRARKRAAILRNA
jgi:hypothetical protein